MNYRVVHTTRYDYGQLASVNHNQARLWPRTFPGQVCTACQIDVEPEPAERCEHADFFGNRVTYFSVRRPHRRMAVTATSDVHLDPEARPPAADMPWEEARGRLEAAADPEAIRTRLFVLGSPLCSPSAPLSAYGAPSFPPGRPLLAGVADLMQRIHGDYDYVPEHTTITTPLAQLLEDRRGVCQDFAHLAIGCLRALGLAARYVSGYLETVPPPGAARLRGADASHAWYSVYQPGAGWFDFDPTNATVPRDRHITAAWGRDYADVTPLKGVVFGSGAHQLTVTVDVERRQG